MLNENERHCFWKPKRKRIEDSALYAFQRKMEDKYKQKFSSYQEFHAWSIKESESFWSELFDFFQIKYEGNLNPACGDFGFSSYDWFKNIRLNFAENLLCRGRSDDIALQSLLENGSKQDWSYSRLKLETSLLAQGLAPYVKKGDVVGAYMPNIPETVVSMLATSSLGGVFTSTSCDFGVNGVMDRFGQSRPKVIIAASGYEYNGKYFDLLPRLKEIEEKLEGLELLIVVDFLDQKSNLDAFNKAILWDDLLGKGDSNQALSFTSCCFQDPLYIMYSSGTTGKPKCIVHTIGGTLLQHVKELGLHTDLNHSKGIFYFTTCGWMMWNWLVSSLFFGSRVVLYEGAPALGGIEKFLSRLSELKISILGTSPKFLRAMEEQGIDLKEKDCFDELETILSTGAPLLPEQYDYVYNSFKKDVALVSICGGTDIIGCFMLGDPTAPVFRGEIQALGLGMDVACFNEKGEAVIDEEGELVCRKSFPSRPLYFLGDRNNEKIKDAYFSRYDNVWHHGDFITITRYQTVKVFGRSDATLNPGGVRIGTAEIYRQTETLDFIEDSLCVGKQNHEGDVDIVLFIKLIEGEKLCDHKKDIIKKMIRQKTTPRHVPKYIFNVSGIPYTRSGKKMELAVNRILNGKKLNNLEAVANPECLDEYKALFK